MVAILQSKVNYVEKMRGGVSYFGSTTQFNNAMPTLLGLVTDVLRVLDSSHDAAYA